MGRIANRLRQQGIIGLLKLIAGALEIGHLRVGLRQRLRSGGAMAGGLRLHRPGDLSPPGLHAFPTGLRQRLKQPGGGAKKNGEEGGQSRPPDI